MALHLYNTLSNKVEEFSPSLDNTVRMYACGPTVYDYGHIGNFRTFVAVDIMRRFLRQSGFKLNHVMNITDVDDKIIRNAAHEHKTVQEYTRKYEEAFLEDMQTLSLERPERMVRATERIQEMAAFIQQLEQTGFAYPADNASYYFRTPTMKPKPGDQNGPPARPSPASGCTWASCWWKARRCPRARATSLPCATCCSRATSRRPSATCLPLSLTPSS